MADDGDARRVVPILLGGVRAAAVEAGAERREVAVVRDRGVDHFRRAPFGDVDAGVLEDRHVFERGRVALVEEEDVGRDGKLRVTEAGGAAPDVHQPVGVRVGQRLEQDGVDDAEDGGGGADPERERQ
jgi:hypothetical protein